MIKRMKGFTLIEMLVVIAIIGVVATIGLGGYVTTQKRSRDAKRVGDTQAIGTAQEQYFAIEGEYADMGDGGQTCSFSGLSTVLNANPNAPFHGTNGGAWDYRCDRDSDSNGIHGYCIAVKVESGAGNCYGCVCDDADEMCTMQLTYGPPPAVEGLADVEPTIGFGDDPEPTVEGKAPTPTIGSKAPTVTPGAGITLKPNPTSGGIEPTSAPSGYTHYCVVQRQ